MSDELHNYTETGIVRSSDDIVTLLRAYDKGAKVLDDAADEIERLRAERAETQDSLELWRSLANALTRDLAFRTDDKTADFIVQQMVARIYRERAVRGE